MTLETIGILAEVVGALAVVVSLLFVGFEVRRNRKAMESASMDALAAGFNTLNTHVMDSEELTEIYLKGTANPHDLNETQRARFLVTVQSYVNHYTTLKKYYDSGLLPEDQWLAHSRGLNQLMGSVGGLWAIENITVTPAIVAEFKKLQTAPRKDGYLAIATDE